MSQDKLFCFRDKIIFCNIMNYLFLKFQTAVYFVVAVKAFSAMQRTMTIHSFTSWY